MRSLETRSLIGSSVLHRLPSALHFLFVSFCFFFFFFFGEVWGGGSVLFFPVGHDPVVGSPSTCLGFHQCFYFKFGFSFSLKGVPHQWAVTPASGVATLPVRFRLSMFSAGLFNL